MTTNAWGSAWSSSAVATGPIGSYSALSTAISSFLNRTDLSGQIPYFVTLMESQLRRRLKKAMFDGFPLPRSMVTSIPNLSIPAGTEFLNAPSDFLGGVLSFYLDPQSVNGNEVGAIQIDYISPMNLQYLKQKRGPNASNDEPSLFTIVGNQFQLLPIADFNYTGYLWYWQDFNNLAATQSGTNWILANHPDVYLYGCLTAAAPFLFDDNRVELWGTLFTQGMEDLITSDPIPNDRAWLRMESGLTFRPNSMTAFDIVSGDFIHGI